MEAVPEPLHSGKGIDEEPERRVENSPLPTWLLCLLLQLQSESKKELGSVAAPYLQDFARTRLDDSELLVLASGGQEAPICVEGHAKDDVRVAVNHLHRLADVQVPDEDLKRERLSEDQTQGKPSTPSRSAASAPARKLELPKAEAGKSGPSSWSLSLLGIVA